MIVRIVTFFLLMAGTANGALYYVSPTGFNSNDGSAATTGGGHGPFLTFAYAINPARAWCGDTLILVDGTYGDSPEVTTGKLLISGVNCSQGNEMTVRALNQRMAKIVDNGSGQAILIQNSSYITVDGLYATSTNNNSQYPNAGRGTPVQIRTTHHITVRNMVAKNPNTFVNSHVYSILYSRDITFEDNEGYSFHRHCVEATQDERVYVRRQYCNPREGKIPATPGNNGSYGIFGHPISSQGPPGSGAAVMSMYPCKDCILENAISEGKMFLVEMNATYAGNILMSGSKVFGSICYGTDYGNCVYPNGRDAIDTNHSPQNILIQNVVALNYATVGGSAFKCQDCIGVTIDHASAFGTGVSGNGFSLIDQPGYGVAAANMSADYTNSLATGFGSSGFVISATAADWGIDYARSTTNTTNFSPSSSPRLTNSSTTAHGLGTCRLWVPAGASVKGAGTGGSDIGANILYRYVNGVLTTTRLWDPSTGAFPYGAPDADNVNRVAGKSLFDFHTRSGLNINSGGCSFPAGYVPAGGGSGPTNPSTHQSGIGTTSLSWSHTLPGGTQGLLVAVSAYDPGANVGTINTPTACAGQSVTAIPGAESVSSPPYRRTKVFGITSPTTGSCTITTSISGNASFMAGESIQIATMGSFGTSSVATALSSTPTVTVTAPTGEQIFDFLGAKCVPVSGACTTTLSFGSNQTFQKDIASAGDLRLATSNKSTNNGPMSATMGANNYWTYVAVPVLSASPTPDTAVITQDAYQLITGYGDMDTANLLTASSNTPYSVGSEAFLRIRFRVAGSVATAQPFGSSVYCRKDADSFTRAVDTFGSNTFRLLGPGAELEHPKVPASATMSATSRTGASNFDGAAFLRDESSVIIVPSLAVGHTYEVEAAIVLNGSNNNVYQCQLRKDDGTQLVYSQTPSVTVRPGLAGFTR